MLLEQKEAEQKPLEEVWILGGGCIVGGDLEIGGGCFTGGGGGFSTLVGSIDLETEDSRLVLNNANKPDRLRVLVVS